jgi:hypothetical protein
LGVAGEVSGFDICNAPLVHIAGSDQAIFDQLAQPGGGLFVELIVVDGH